MQTVILSTLREAIERKDWESADSHLTRLAGFAEMRSLPVASGWILGVERLGYKPPVMWPRRAIWRRDKRIRVALRDPHDAASGWILNTYAASGRLETETRFPMR